ncbi:NUDIX hydrolase domain-like protein [Hypoxylon argillaceum]|nr:NUDIX hydrolase domain-like protein [Hypoxylon argillaceum]
MSTTVTNGDYDASLASTTSLPRQEEGDSNKHNNLGTTHSPPTAFLETAEAPQSQNQNQNQSPTNPSAILPADLGLALSADLLEQTASRQTQEHQGGHQQTLSEAQDQASYYWDASSMAPLNALSAAAIARLRAYKPPPFPTWDRLPVSRRAAVLILLFADRRGDLRVVITMRAASLRNFSGHAAFPGGKADSLNESPYQIARREAWEEIGLPMDDTKIPRPFRIEPLCSLPCSLAKTELAVRPCVAFLHSDGAADAPTVDEAMIPRLDAKEVAAVFSAPFAHFLRAADEEPRPGEPPLPPGHWYDGRWINLDTRPWRVHNFHVPVHAQRVTTPRVREGGLASLSEDEDESGDGGPARAQRFLVWGMTGRILVDAARVAYAREPEFEHNDEYGDEALIELQAADGRMMTEKTRKEVGLDATREEVKDAKI